MSHLERVAHIVFLRTIYSFDQPLHFDNIATALNLGIKKDTCGNKLYFSCAIMGTARIFNTYRIVVV
jgi:hypothetical protein